MSSALSQLLAISAPLIASVQARPVSSIRWALSDGLKAEELADPIHYPIHPVEEFVLEEHHGELRQQKANPGSNQKCDHHLFLLSSRPTGALHSDPAASPKIEGLWLTCGRAGELESLGASGMFSAAIFDMDGLLIDSERATMNAWIGAAKHYGIDFYPSDYLPVIGQTAADSDWILISRFGSQSTFHQVSEKVSELLELASPDVRFPLKPGVLELLSSLRTKGIPCAVASSSRVSEIRDRLSAVGVLEFFQALSGGDEVIKGKPDPAVYQLAAARLGMSSVSCLAFEDSENGALSAFGAGSNVVLVPDLKPPCAFVTSRCFHILNSLHESLEHIPRWFAFQ